MRLNEQHAAVILDSIADGVFTIDLQWNITSFNRAAEKITGISRKDAIGIRCCDIFRASVCESACVLRRTIDTQKPIVNRAIFITNSVGQRLPISVSTGLLRDQTGKIIGGVETFRDLSLVEELRKDLQGRHSFEDIISRSPQMQGIFDLLPRAAESDSPILIEGESGTGKELIAQALHRLSPRRRKPLVAINCGALPETLLESELFGYKAGAFTDAKKDKPGRFALAEGGTLFLDEIGELTQKLQVKLLRVLQEQVYEPLGSTNPVKTNVRILSATNQSVIELVQKKQFRQDFFYRINVLRIVLPPLRQRSEDIPILVEHFIRKFNRIRGLNIAGISHEAMELLMAHDYPGNIRELENLIEHAFILCHSGNIRPEHLPAEIRSMPGKIVAHANSLQELERDFIGQLLHRHQHDRHRVAQELGIHEVTLWRKMKKLGLKFSARL
ncbi:MAG: sigma 54-interacting transcriptional regulator [Candidatus Ozemobacteraceae bacterium]